MAKEPCGAKLRVSLEKVVEGTNQSVSLLKSTVEKLAVLMSMIKDAQRSNAL